MNTVFILIRPSTSYLGCNSPSIVDEKIYSSQFTADKVFEDSEDIWGVNYWLTGNGKVRDEAYFVMDRGCPTEISSLTVRNTHNDNYNDRGMKQMSVFTSTSASGPWNNIHTATLPDPRNAKPSLITYQVSGQGRFVKVQVDSFYGLGGGLQFFGINTEKGDGDM